MNNRGVLTSGLLLILVLGCFVIPGWAANNPTPFWGCIPLWRIPLSALCMLIGCLIVYKSDGDWFLGFAGGALFIGLSALLCLTGKVNCKDAKCGYCNEGSFHNADTASQQYLKSGGTGEAMSEFPTVALSVKCPFCGAEKGERCRTVELERPYHDTYSHKARDEAYFEWKWKP